METQNSQQIYNGSSKFDNFSTIFQMNKQLNFSRTNTTADTFVTKLHNCPNCRCASPKSRPISPIYHRPNSPYAISMKPTIYYRKIESDSICNRSHGSISPSPRKKIVRSPAVGPARVSIRYISPARESAKLQYAEPQSALLSSTYSFGREEEPKKPKILFRERRVGEKKNHLFANENTKSKWVETQYRYKSEEEDKVIAESIIKELSLNYDYFSAQELSDISAEVSL